MERIADLTIAFLAVYGMIMLAKRFNHWLYRKSLENKDTTVSWVLMVKDQEKAVEGLLRQLVAIYREDLQIADLYVMDLGSADATVDIIRRLSKSNREFIVVERRDGAGWDEVITQCRGRAICILDLKQMDTADLPHVALKLSKKISANRNLQRKTQFSRN
ncbi:hypothetical protein MFMK1_000707 [Metallumcola ferriviriculae]|uniref:Glycosyltransferase 2-like domain-containing protein n=1 Tax=Metallumcola ferriviriculae TaxID=3039180 RepID=A0AAU0UL22_9FIRM|nr:hypothetical protein MFMK1_000707 [Desulfitibacteraceae bacterium MK1]